MEKKKRMNAYKHGLKTQSRNKLDRIKRKTYMLTISPTVKQNVF